MEISQGFDITEKAYRKLIDNHIEAMTPIEMELVDLLEAFRLYALLSMGRLQDKGIEV